MLKFDQVPKGFFSEEVGNPYVSESHVDTPGKIQARGHQGLFFELELHSL